MEIHLVSDINCNIVNLKCPIVLRGVKINVWFTFSVGDTTWAIYD